MDSVEIVADASMDTGIVSAPSYQSADPTTSIDSAASYKSSPQKSTIATSPSNQSSNNTTTSNPFDQFLHPPPPQSHYTTPERQSRPETDDPTDPSSSATGHEGMGYTRSDSQQATSTFGRMVQSAKKQMIRKNSSTVDGDKGEDEEDDQYWRGALIYGFLQKLGRNGKWQTRWFESDGECLTYYKSSKRSKLLATLDLAKVGSIVINHDDPEGASFTINIAERPYHLRADSKAACRDWVITLNRVKEARMQEGNVKLLAPDSSQQPPDLLTDSFTPRVVVVANRHRTRAVDDEEFPAWESGGNMWNNENPAKRNSGFSLPTTTGRLARWQKPRTSLSRIATKLVQWAKSIRNYGCTDVEHHVILDHHVHPPGHDDKPKRPSSPRDMGNTESSVQSGVVSNLDSDSASHSANHVPVDDEEETRELS